MPYYLHTKITKLNNLIIFLILCVVILIFRSIALHSDFQYIDQQNRFLTNKTTDLEFQRDSIDFLRHRLQKINDSLMNSKIQSSKKKAPLISTAPEEPIIISPVLVVDSIK